MRWIMLVVLPMLALSASGAGDALPGACRDLPACVLELRTLAGASKGRSSGMGSRQGDLKQRILAYPGAVDALVPLLKDPDDKVAVLASYVLRDAPSIDPTHLPAIREGLDRGLSWLAPALARIGTDEAAREAVDRYLVSDDAPENQEGYAVQLSGRRAIPYIVERASCRVPCRDDTHYLLGVALGRMGQERSAAGPGLMRIASDRDAPPQAPKGALLMIAELGIEGRSLEADLIQEREISPYLAPWIDQALVGIRSSKTGAIYAARLVGDADLIALRDLAESGVAGRDAGPAVVRILERQPDLRAAAARTLGYIGYAESAPALVAALDDPKDPRVAWAAATSLGRLKAGGALPALERTASQHWYLPVRVAAREAAMRIRSGAADEAPKQNGHFPFEFLEFDSINSDLADCQKHTEKVVREPAGKKLHASASSSRLQKLKYASYVLSYGASDEKEQEAAGTEVISVHPGNIVEHRETIEQVPHVALRVEGGWLAGSNRGEWGGELMFIGDDGRSQRIYDDNIEDIHELRTRIVATTGIAHLGLNSGSLLEVTRESDGTWRTSIWRVLPAAPAASYLVEPRALMIETVGGGAVVVDPNGGMRMANCVG